MWEHKEIECVIRDTDKNSVPFSIPIVSHRHGFNAYLKETVE